jgi:hypothetical protein
MQSSLFLGIMLCSPLKFNDVSEEHVASIFSSEEQAKQESRMKHCLSADYIALHPTI